MYVPAHFATSPQWCRDFVRANPFATIAGMSGGEIVLAYVAVVFDEGPRRLRFHLARSNPLAEIAGGARLKASFMGAHTYISPSWYASGEQVPTWNYCAVEIGGTARRLGDPELLGLLSDLTAQQERALAPKPPWTMGDLPAVRLRPLLSAIMGFEIAVETMEGKLKLSQNRSAADIASAIAALEARDDHSARSVAAAMRRHSVK